MPDMILIGLAGKAGAGKTTAAQILCGNLGFERLRFADPLKEMLFTLLEWLDVDDELQQRMIEGDLKNAATPLLFGKSPREAMQTLGHEWGRSCIGENLWTACMRATIRFVRRADVADGTPTLIVIDDVRFQNEVDLIRSMGGVVIEVKRPGLEPVNAHASETQELEGIEGHLWNDGPIEILRERIEGHVDRMLARGTA